MQIINLTAWNNQDYVFTVSLAAWAAAGYDLVDATFVKTARLPTAPADQAPSLFFSSAGVTGQGLARVVPDTKNGNALTALQFIMPASLIRSRVAAGTVLAYDAMYAYGNVVRLLYGGTLTVEQGQSTQP